MNYLAHAYLSFNDEDLLIGNLISDYLKGKTKFGYEPGIYKGIMLHREIDTFTDFHAQTKKACVILKRVAGLYAGAFVDVIFDHFLARDKEQFISQADVQNHAQWVYKTLDKNESILPEKFRLMLPYMKRYDWLSNYHHLDAINNSFNGIFRKAKYLDETPIVYEAFITNYDFFEACYKEFFPDLKAFVKMKINATAN